MYEETPMTRKYLWVAAILASGMALVASPSIAQTPADAKPAVQYNPISLTHFAATVAAVFRIEPPKQAEPPVESVAQSTSCGPKLNRATDTTPE